MSLVTEKIADRIPGWVVFVFSLGLFYQGLHYLEHLAQLYQHAVLNVSILHAHGILFFLDLEWNHFIFNFFYFFVLITLLWAVWKDNRRHYGRVWTLFSILLSVGVTVAAWHAIEHAVRISQHLASGCEPCLGIVGQYVDVVYLHTVYNSLVFVVPLLSYFIGGFHRRFFRML